jgi:hypothetical protein
MIYHHEAREGAGSRRMSMHRMAAYVDGVHAKGDPALMRQGFHPDFRS